MGVTQSNTVHFIHGCPKTQGATVEPLFEKANGMLFLIKQKINNINKLKRFRAMWSFYNDTLQYEMHIRVIFDRLCYIEALEDTYLVRNQSGEWIGTVIVPPCTTMEFVRGRINGYSIDVKAVKIDQNDAIVESPYMPSTHLQECEKEAMRKL